MSKTLITEEMLIADVMRLVPKAADIMMAYGLHCTSCSVNAFEPIKGGAMGHGMSEDDANSMLKEINEAAGEIIKAPEDGIYITEAAANKVKEFAKAENKEGYGLRIRAESKGAGLEPVYAMDFEKKSKKGDKKYEFHNLKIFIEKDSIELLMGASIDYFETPYGSGFKIDNPKFWGKKSCSCGSGGCGGGSCGCSD